MGQDEGKQQRKSNKLKKTTEQQRHTAEKCDHWMAICLSEEEVGQACFLKKPCSYLIIHDNGRSVKHLKNAKFTSEHQQADYGVTLRTNWKKANAQAPAVAVYLLWATFSKGHLTEPVPSGGLWLRRAGGHLSDPTARGVGGGGKGGGGQGGGGGGSWGGRTSREKGIAPPAIRAVPGAL